MQPCRGASARSPPRPVPAQPAPSLARTFPTPSSPGIRAREPAQCPPRLVLARLVALHVFDEAQKQNQGCARGRTGERVSAPGRALLDFSLGLGPDSQETIVHGPDLRGSSLQG